MITKEHGTDECPYRYLRLVPGTEAKAPVEIATVFDDLYSVFHMIKYSMPQKTISSSSLRTGMFVVLPSSWFSHPFIKNSFLISSQAEIDQILESGFDEVIIDTDKGDDIGVKRPEQEVRTPPPSWTPETLVPPQLREAIHDEKLAPEKKAKIVYESSIQLMERLLEEPRAENIKEAKKGIAEIVDLVMADDETSFNLLNITSHDYYTYTHSVNVGVYSILLAKAYLGKDDSHNMQELGAGFFLHDIGKVKISPDIINKPGRLTDEEMQEMRTHPNRGYKILSETSHLTDECKIIVMEHHERHDGKGYPLGLKGDDIHIYGRICSVADVFDALTAERAYKKKKGVFEALTIMRDEMLGHFQKDLFESFVMLFSRR